MAINGDAPADEDTSKLIQAMRRQQIAGATLGRYVGSGASSLVFQCETAGKVRAIKVYKPDFLKKIDLSTEAQRIKRQLELKNECHPNLLRIIDGGMCPASGYTYVLMPLIDAKNLDEVRTEIPRAKIPSLISQLASAAQRLEELGFVHRDIKPSNIAIKDEYSRLVLLDHGIIRPIGESDLTDHTGHTPFLGTRRYSPPEFIDRREVHSQDGYRAITYYQIGAVIYELLTQRMLFEEDAVSPPLAERIRTELPNFTAVNDLPHLVQLGIKCLAKDPHARLLLVGHWSSFSKHHVSSVEDIKSQLAAYRRVGNQFRRQPEHLGLLNPAESALVRETAKEISIADGETFPPHEVDFLADAPDTMRLIYYDSTSHSIPECIHFYLRLSINSDTLRYVSIRYAIAIGPLTESPNADEIKLNSVQTVLFPGELTKALQLILYNGMLDAVAYFSESQAVTSSGGLTWINVREVK